MELWVWVIALLIVAYFMRSLLVAAVFVLTNKFFLTCIVVGFVVAPILMILRLI